MKSGYKQTMYACFVGYIVQAIVNNFAPLLFLTFQTTYGIPLEKITFLVTFNFGLQLAVDFLSAGFVDKLGYRASAVLAHILAALGLLSLAVLPEILPNAFAGLVIAVVIYAMGGGLLEVLISPIVEACPSDNKASAMSLLHSFYCWGYVAVVLLSTVFFAVFGIHNWKMLAVIWAVIPALNAVFFTKVPIAGLMEEGEKGLSVRELLSNKIFWVMTVLMVCAGASEQSVSQWASVFAEKGLGIAKTAGDLAGPMLFAVLMGCSRTLFSRVGEKIGLQRTILSSAVLCLASYLLIVFSKNPILGLVGCSVCGFSVGALWPGTFSIASAGIRRGGTSMFAFLALAGDLGCSAGPTVVGRVAGLAGGDLKMGFLAACVFPILLMAGILANGALSGGILKNGAAPGGTSSACAFADDSSSVGASPGGTSGAKLLLQACAKFFLGLAAVCALLFFPAGTLQYWNAWLFIALLFAPMLALGIFLWVKSPDLLEKRLNSQEKESGQKRIVVLSGLVFVTGFVAAACDFRFGWSHLPLWLVFAGGILLLAAYGLFAEVTRENAFLSRTVEIQENQKVIDIGLYGLVRHPMYLAMILLYVSIPIVLGSAVSLLIFLIFPFLIAGRISGEEAVLEQGLPGYAEYKKRVRYKVIPFVW